MHSSPRESGFASVSAPALMDGAAGRAGRARALHGKLGWTLALAICCAYLIFFVRLTSFPLQDYPNHVARGVVMADLLFQHGARFGQQFSTQLMAVPYILGDLVLAASMELFGTVGGTGVFTVFVLLSLPCALLFYMSVNKLAPQARLFVFLLSLYLSTDWFWLMGFMAFRLSIAAIVATLALADLLRGRWSVAMYLVYLGVLVLSYLIHLTWLVFFAVVLGVSAAVRWWFGTTTVRREISLFAPLVALLVWQFGVVPSEGDGNLAVYSHDWGSLALKLKSFLAEFRGFGGHLPELMIVMFGLCIFWPVRYGLRSKAWLKPTVLEQLAIAAAFLVIYIALPRDLKYTAFIDVRALPLIVLFVILAVLRMPSDASQAEELSTTPVLALALLLTAVNLGYLILHVGANNAWLERYRAVVQSVPEGAPVLSVYAGRQAGSRPFLHAGSFVLIDRGGLTPYLFTGDHGDPMLYFRFRHRHYRPAEDWYDAQRLRNLAAAARENGGQSIQQELLGDGNRPWYETTEAPDWQRVACEYGFLLITMPFDRRLIGVPTRTVAENQSAALLEITEKPACTR